MKNNRIIDSGVLIQYGRLLLTFLFNIEFSGQLKCRIQTWQHLSRSCTAQLTREILCSSVTDLITDRKMLNAKNLIF